MNYYSLDYIDHKKGQTNQWKGKCDDRLNRTMERKNVIKHIFQGYILPKDKQSMISMTGYNMENPFRKGERNIMTLPIQRCLVNLIKNI